MSTYDCVICDCYITAYIEQFNIMPLVINKIVHDDYVLIACVRSSTFAIEYILVCPYRPCGPAAVYTVVLYMYMVSSDGYTACMSGCHITLKFPSGLMPDMVALDSYNAVEIPLCYFNSAAVCFVHVIVFDKKGIT